MTLTLQADFAEVIAYINPIALRKAKIVYNFGLSECNRVKNQSLTIPVRVEEFLTD